MRAQLLQLFYSIRSERLLMEQLDYNILFRWFVGLEIDEPIWVPTVFTKIAIGCCSTPSPTVSSSAWSCARPI